MKWPAVAAAVALFALAALFLARDHARSVRADPTADDGAASPVLPEAVAGPGAAPGVGASPIAPTGAARPETFAVEVVSSPGSRPVAGARVEAWEDERMIASALTDSSGLASLTATRAGGMLLVASCRGFVPSEYWLYEDERETPLLFLRPGLAVDGTVTLADTGQPAVGAEVVIGWPSNVHLRLRTDTRGRFEIPGVADGLVIVMARLAGYEPVEKGYGANPASPRVEIVLGRGGRCEGRVTDEAEMPVAGAFVRIGEHNPWCSVETVTDAEGRFTARGLPHGEERRVYAETADHRSGMSEPFTCDADNPVHRCEIVVRPYARVAVALSFPDGSPVLEANVAVSSKPGFGDQRWCRAVTSGLFESGSVEPGENEIRVSTHGWPLQRRKILVSPGVRNEIAFQLEERLGIEGIVVDPEGSPVRGIEVDLYEPRVLSGEADPAEIADVRTDADGRFRIRGLAGTEGALVCADDDTGYLPLTTDVRPGEPPLRVVLDRRPRIVGRLDPVPESLGLDVSIGCGNDWAGGSARVGRDGRFELRNLVVPAGREFWLRLDAGGDLPWVFLGLDLAPNETLDLGTLRPPAGVTLEGVVTDQAGRPLADAEVIASAEIEELYTGGGADTDAKGRFVIHDLVDVPFDVRATREGYAPWKLHIERPSAAPPLTIALEPGGALEIPATPWDVEGVEIEAVDGSFRDSLYTSQKEPSVVWLKPGAYRVNDSTLEIRVGETTRFELRR